MAPIGKIYGPLSHPISQRAYATAAFAGLEVEEAKDYKHMEDNKTEAYLSKFPMGKIPAFEGSDGFCLFEASAIARYFASLAPNSGLLGNDAKEAALVDQWISVAEKEIFGQLILIFRMLRGMIQPYSKPIHTSAEEAQTRALNVVEKHLATRTFLVNERITLADIIMATVTKMCASVNLGAAERAKFPNTIRHLETVWHQPSMAPVFGTLTMVDEAQKYTPPPKEKKEAAPKPPQEPKPKAEKKKAKDEDDDDDEPLVPEEPKAKNPLDSLPKSTLNLEDWKRAYSNKDTRGAGGSLEWFYENYDKEGYSIWRCDFKYNSELTQTFMSSNQIGGFFNRLEASRKYLFGSMGVLGKTNDSIITGVLVCRGKDFKPVIDVAPDWESYEYKEIDLSNADDKAFFEGALAWDLEVGGKAWADGKNFK